MLRLDVATRVLVAVKIAGGLALTPLAHKFVRKSKVVVTIVLPYATMAAVPRASYLAGNLANMVAARDLVAMSAIHVSNPAIGHANIKARVRQSVASLAVGFHATNHVLNYYPAVICARVCVVSVARKSALSAW